MCCQKWNDITSGQRGKTKTATTTVVKFTFTRKRNLQYCRRNDQCSGPLAGGVGRHFFLRDHKNKFLTVTRESLKTPGRISGSSTSARSSTGSPKSLSKITSFTRNGRIEFVRFINNPALFVCLCVCYWQPWMNVSRELFPSLQRRALSLPFTLFVDRCPINYALINPSRETRVKDSCTKIFN